MKQFFRELDMNLSSALSPVVKWIVYICCGVYLITLVGGSVSPSFVIYEYKWLGASLSDTILKGRVWQLITYAFVHVGFFHLLFNLMGLYFFGQRLEYRWGSEQFTKFCLIVGVGAVLTHLAVVGLIHLATGGSMGPVIVGISGIVYGVMLVSAMYYPDDIIYFQFLIPIKLKYFVAIMAFITFITAGQQSGIAQLTHLGGLIFAYLFVKTPKVFDWIPAPRNPFKKRKPQFVDPRERWRRF